MIASSRPKLAKVCVVGGGHGLEASISAARQLAEEVTAVVGVADDGGSSGRLRDIFGLIPPGDMRRCMSSFLPDDSMVKDIIEYRFKDGEFKDHALGNLVFLAALDIFGSTCRASAFMTDLFGVSGKVLPASEEPLTLCAELYNGRTIRGQVQIHLSSGIKKVWVEPDLSGSPTETIEAIASADAVVLGPGSLYTSVLAAAVVPDVRRALADAKGTVVFVANLKEQPNETIGVDVGAQIRALTEHQIRYDFAIVDSSLSNSLDSSSFERPLMVRDVTAAGGYRHDALALARALEEILF
ncbi:conserved hypothetical protein, cofD-related [Ferrithrix thermotolerans DSM 19514]|uniref:Gluconeogenesis factor n=1 Tax=Ferrithrix thermotolerans DSM 19514 TaxID=1121881 RepID=A0A1M4SCB9_9ACTN|nr:gluconeogenesis factor YvcK family protein [Ferrithrix thermotolerans]SHE29818.1 conserved hypothetical protein, cofD-related [Ferrithrix thermotolerans DSM 19514]